MIRNRVAFVGPRSRRIHDVDLDVVHVNTVFLQSPVHQSHVPEHRISGLRVETVSRHADGVPVGRIRDVIFHEVCIVIGASLGRYLQIHTALRMAHADAGFDAEFMAGFLHEAQIHFVGNLALNQCPPDAALVRGAIDKDRGVAIASLTEVHGGGSVARTK